MSTETGRPEDSHVDAAEADLAPEASAEPLDASELGDGTDEDAAAFAQEAAEAAAAAALAAEQSLQVEAEAAAQVSEERPTADEEALAQEKGDTSPDSLDNVTPEEIVEPEEQAAAEKLAAKAARLSAEQVRHTLHAILFVSDKPLSVEQLKQATGVEPKKIQKALDKLSGELREGVSGVVLSEVAGGWQLRTAPEAAEFVRRFLQVKPRRLTRAALETLAIIAYRQPVTRPEIEDIRGVDCGAVLKALADWHLVKVLGRKDEVGRPILYGTTREFLEFFQLKDLSALPTLREFQELTEESRSIVEEELGPEAVQGIEGTVAQLSDPAYLAAEAERVAKSEAALAELEMAMADTEVKASTLATAIAPPKSAPEADASASEAPAAPTAEA